MLYVAETDALRSYTYDPVAFKASEPELLVPLPSGEGHYTRTLMLHPDGQQLLIAVGSSCNVCNEKEPERAAVLSYNLDTKTVAPFASGLRNTVFMAAHPVTQQIWGTENGRDLIGDDIPPDEINIIEQGKNYGWPFCYGNKVLDTDFSGTNSSTRCDDTEAALIDLPAHAAALGLAFVTADTWPTEYADDLLVALHGSWNRSEPSGYKVIRIPLDESGKKAGEPTDFMTGFITADAQDGDEAKGRPVAILAEENSIVYITDDKAGAVYAIAPASN
jgi:glucose/arabinose dehydrogenase